MFQLFHRSSRKKNESDVSVFDLYVLDTFGGKLKFAGFPFIKTNIY